MTKPIDHYVQVILRKSALTDEMRARFLGLYDKVKDQIPGFLSYQVAFLEDGPGETCAVCHRMVFADEAALMAFKNCKEHLAHRAYVSSAGIETNIRDF